MSDRLPIYETGLEEVIKACRGSNLFFRTNVYKHVGEADIIFRCDSSPAHSVHVCWPRGHPVQWARPATGWHLLAAVRLRLLAVVLSRGVFWTGGSLLVCSTTRMHATCVLQRAVAARKGCLCDKPSSDGHPVSCPVA